MSEPDKPFYEFGPFTLDTREKVLLRDGKPVPLKPKGYRVLLALVERSGFIVEKDYFMREVWDGSLRDESNLPQQVSVLRKTLGELEGGNGGDQYIETVATRGYKFIATVRAVQSLSVSGETPAPPTQPPATETETEPETINEDSNAASLILRKRTEIRVARNGGERVVAANPQRNPAELLPSASTSRAGSSLFGLGKRGTLLAALIFCSVLVIGLLEIRSQRQAAMLPTNTPAAVQPVPVEINSIAVLPFRVQGEAAGNDYLEMGLAESIAMKLGGISSLTVRPMSAVERQLRQSGDDHLATGRALRTDAVLEGSLQQVGDLVRVTAQLLRVSDGKQLWAGSFDEESAQVFRIQDAISEQLVSGLSLKLGEGERDRLARRHTQNPDAYRLYLLGRYFWRIDAKKSRHYHQQSLAADPSYALAHAGLADSYAFGGLNEAPLAERHAREALRIDDSLAEPHATLGFVQMFSRWQWEEAGKEFRRALELNPHYATGHQWYAIYLACEGRTTEALARMQQAVDLDPLSPAINADLGQMYFFAGDRDGALAACRRALELDPKNGFALLYSFYINAAAGREKEAAEAYLKFTDSADPAGSRVRQAGFRDAGLRGLLLQDIDHFLRVSGNLNSYNRVAEDYALLGDREQTLNWLEKSVESRNFFMAFIKVNPLFGNLREEPRFKTLVQRVGLT